jgi:hypothetical protein
MGYVNAREWTKPRTKQERNVSENTPCKLDGPVYISMAFIIQEFAMDCTTESLASLKTQTHAADQLFGKSRQN